MARGVGPDVGGEGAGVGSEVVWRFLRDCCDRSQDVPSFRRTSERCTLRAAESHGLWPERCSGWWSSRLRALALPPVLVWRGGRRYPLVPPRRAASCASLCSSTLLRPCQVQPASIGGDCRSAPAAHPRHSGPGCGVV